MQFFGKFGLRQPFLLSESRKVFAEFVSFHIVSAFIFNYIIGHCRADCQY